ncbi:hypothetical protein [Mesorhizobium sp.]|uniref:hypothetical protein n=1 Tax=Mesorhizobium sp. TaxID=1871066 RepID=UPI0025BA0165|nr:hypothetical protein [Mesorhizobium sp.]
MKQRMLFLQACAISSFGDLALVANTRPMVEGHNWGAGAMKLRCDGGSAVLTAILLMVAQAGDAAARHIIGFSPDASRATL